MACQRCNYIVRLLFTQRVDAGGVIIVGFPRDKPVVLGYISRGDSRVYIYIYIFLAVIA